MTEQDPQQRVDQIETLLARLGDEYRDDPNVVSIGFGLREQEGEVSSERALVFYVRRKLGSDRLLDAAGTRRVPARIDGFATDVQELTDRRAATGQRDDRQYDPLLGGPASSNAANHIAWFNGSGTLGLLVRDAVDGTPMALSNWHVWGDGGETGDDIIQPGHPTTGDHLEAVGKVAACGPLVTSLIEWEVPSPLTAGLYGGAAAAAVAAAASDVADPTRRGQVATPPPAGQLTVAERVDLAIDYPDLPLPGVPFRTAVAWHYERETTGPTLTHDVVETPVNTQFLLGKLVTTDKTSYRPGETVRLVGAIWDYHPRRCEDYHVVAHLIPRERPTTALRVVLHPTACPRVVPVDPPGRPDQELVCVTFAGEEPGERPSAGRFSWLRYVTVDQQPVHVVDWAGPRRGLAFGGRGIAFSHPPARRVVATVTQFTDPPVRAVARDASGQVVDQAESPAVQATPYELVLEGAGIVQVVLRGGGGEGVLLSYCIDPEQRGDLGVELPEPLSVAVRHENPRLALEGRKVRTHRCCFAGTVALPPDEEPGGWDVHLTVQNVNDVPDGTPPEEAATTIGGHLLSAHTSPEVLGCTAIMLADHVFDVI